MPIRHEVEDLVNAGPFPDENSCGPGDVQKLEELELLLRRIERPVSDEEAQVLVTLFGSDDCFGLSWSLLHLIETAPGARDASYLHDSENLWVKTLTARIEFGKQFRA